MIFYHGSDVIVKNPDILHSLHNRKKSHSSSQIANVNDEWLFQKICQLLFNQQIRECF